jgi:hypothetical protein
VVVTVEERRDSSTGMRRHLAARRLFRTGRGLVHSATDRVDKLYCRLVYRSADAVLTADPDRNSPGPLLRLRTPNFQRVHALMALARVIWPPAARAVRERCHGVRYLPFAPGATELLGFGAGCTVFLLRGAGGADGDTPLVLKVYRKSLGRRVVTIQAQLQQLRADYEHLRAWYAECALVVPVSFLILHGPVLGARAGAMLQPYVAPATDCFEPAFMERLPELLRRDRAFRQQLQLFSRRTDAMVRQERMCPDLVGPGNLLVVRRDGRRQLQLIDYGLLDLQALQKKAPQFVAATAERLAWLRSMAQQTSHDHVRTADLHQTGRA